MANIRLGRKVVTLLPEQDTDRYEKISLTDVMRAIHKLHFVTRLPSTVFAFFIGLIMEANEAKYPKMMRLYPIEESALGGGNSRQSVNTNRTKLAKIRIGHKPIVKIHVTKAGRSSYADYEIDFPLLVAQTRLWRRTEDDSSINIEDKGYSSPNLMSIHQEKLKNKDKISSTKREQTNNGNAYKTQRSSCYSSRKIEESQKVPKREENNNKNIIDNVNSRKMPNGMTWGELRKLVLFKPGMFKPSMEDHREQMDFISNQEKSRIEVAIQAVKDKNPHVNKALEWVYTELDQWDYYHGQKKGGAAPVDNRLGAIKQGRQMIRILRGSDEVMKRQAMIQLKALDKYYHRYGKQIYGEAIGMTYTKFKKLIGGDK